MPRSVSPGKNGCYTWYQALVSIYYLPVQVRRIIIVTTVKSLSKGRWIDSITIFLPLDNYLGFREISKQSRVVPMQVRLEHEINLFR